MYEAPVSNVLIGLANAVTSSETTTQAPPQNQYIADR